MVTGDNKHVATRIAKDLGLDEKNVFAECLPKDKIDIIKKLQANKEVVMMAGDGINDAPSLAQANISIAMHSGTDVTQAAADVALLSNNLELIPTIIASSKIMNRKMMQNLFWATGYNIIALPLAAGVLAPWNIQLSPAIGAILMTLSTIVVAINAIRIKI